MTTSRHRGIAGKLFLSLFPVLVLTFLIAGCSSSHTGVATPTVSMSASPTSITPGTSSTLTVSTTNATGVTIAGSDGTTYSLPAAGGTQTVSPKATTTYTATATGAGGSVTATATVTVTANAAPTVTITASPTSITAGGSSTLTVTATNATTVTIKGSDNSSYTLAATGGTQAVTPAATTTYTATATGAGGTVMNTATVTVVTNAPPPTIAITANPTAIAPGASSLLTVTATNAATVTITGTDKSSYPLSATGGIQSVSPSATTTYTATATGLNGTTVTAMATVTVTTNPAPTVTIVASPVSITAGSSSTLTVTAVNNTTLTLTGSDGSTYILTSINGGTQTVSPTTTTTYTATATGPGGTVSAMAVVTVTPNPAPTVTITANPTAVISGNASNLTVVATNATSVTVTGTDGSSYTLQPTGGTQAVTPTATATYTATATGTAGQTATASTTVTVNPPGSIQSINHVVFLLQENHTFDNYFGMLNPYRKANNYNIGADGVDYEVDGIDDKLTTISNQDDAGNAYSLFKFTSTCIEDNSSAWLASFGDVNRYNFLDTRPILMDGFVHNAEGYAKNCAANPNSCSGSFPDLTGKSSMGYYDQGFFNYYYYMASQFALSDRWFSPVASKSVDNRIATFTGGTTQGLVKDPGSDDHLPQLAIGTIFKELDDANVSWKIYYTVTQGFCLTDTGCTGSVYPATDFSELAYSYNYLYVPPTGTACTAPTQASSVVGDTTNSFCIDPTHIAPLSQYYTDVANGTLPSFAFIEAGYGNNDEHPGSGQSVLAGQIQVAKVVNSLMTSPSWKDSVFFLAYDEGGGPYDHVPPVPNHSNDFSPLFAATAPDISSISVNPDSNPNYFPCVPTGTTPTLHCDLVSSEPGANPADAAALQGFGSQIGFRVPNMVISPFTKKHYVSHIPMDHTAIIKFVENRFIGSAAHLTARDAAQPNLLDFFDFNNTPWAAPPTPPTPLPIQACTPTSVGP